MQRNRQLSEILIFCLVVLAFGWPLSQVNANLRSSTNLYYLPSLSNPASLEGVGPDGGGVTTAALNPQNPKIAYSGTWGAGVFKSLDSGKTWKSASAGLSNLYIQSTAVDPVHPDTLYVGTYHNGVYKSTDGGLNWFPAGAGLNTDAIVYALAIDPTNPSTLYAGTRSPGSNPPWGGGVFKSTDGGQTWANHTYNLGEDWVYGLAVDPSNSQIIYAATHSQGVFKSTNGAHSWTAVNNGISDHSMRTVVIDPSNPQVVYAGVWHTTGIFKSTNGGQSWAMTSSGLNGAKIISITIDPVHTQTLYALSYLQGVYKSDNGAGSWNRVGLSPYYVFALTVDPTNRASLLATAVNIDLYHSTNGGGNWAVSSSGLHATTTTAVAADPNSPGVVYAGTTGLGVYRSSDNGQTWSSANAGLGDLNVHSLAVVSGVLYVGTDSGGIYKTSAQKVNWSVANVGLPKTTIISPNSNSPLGRFSSVPGPAADLMLGEPAETIQPKAVTVSTVIQALAPAPSSPATLYAGTGGSGVYRTTDSGASWQSVGLGGKSVYSLMVDRSNPAIVYAGTSASGGSLWLTADGGSNWRQINTGINGLDVLSIAQHPLYSSYIYVGTTQGVFQTVNAGANWARIGLNGLIVYALVGNPNSPNTLAAGTGTGLYTSPNGGATWIYQPGLVNQDVWSLSVGANSTRSLFVATAVGGVFRYSTPADTQ